MKVSYTTQLMEEVVFRHLNHLERSGYRSDYDEYHSLADPIYELPEDDRENAFEKVNRLFFLEKLNLGDYILKALEACGLIPKRQMVPKNEAIAVTSGERDGEEHGEEHGEEDGEGEGAKEEDAKEEDTEEEAPTEAVEAAANEEEEGDEEDAESEVSYDLQRDFQEKILEVIVKRAINKVDEGSNVLNRVSGLPVIEMRVLASRFASPEEALELEAFLIHEFMHARDMVDPVFDYEDAFIPGNPSVKNLITARFRLLWNIYIDSRLARRNIRSTMTREARFREFDNYYRKIPETQRKGMFEGLWETERLTHEELLSMATDLETLINKLDDNLLIPVFSGFFGQVTLLFISGGIMLTL